MCRNYHRILTGCINRLQFCKTTQNYTKKKKDSKDRVRTDAKINPNTELAEVN